MKEFDIMMEKYAEIAKEKLKTNEHHNHPMLYDWEIETFNRIFKKLEKDEEAKALIANILNYAMVKDSCFETW